MSKFFVGQRVRYTRAGNSYCGSETTILALDVPGVFNGRRFFGAKIDLPNDYWTADGFAVVEYAVLVPLTPPKSQELVSWDEMPCTRDGKYRQPEVVGVGQMVRDTWRVA
jgi:hypothetical protein